MGYAKEWLEREEWKNLKDQDMPWRDELLLKITYRGALRISEALNLRYPYDFTRTDDNGFVTIRSSKTSDTPEEQPIGKDLVKETERFMYSEDKETSYVFSSRQDTKMTRQRAYQIINEYAEKAEIEKKLGTHTLRRSRAKHMLDEGHDLSFVSKFLRHGDLKTTMEYLKIAKKHLADRARELDEKYGL